MKKIKDILNSYKDIVYYIIFGVFTTVINWGTYFLCYSTFKIPNVPSTVLAWIIAVIFAFITNKIWVFNSKSWDFTLVIGELFKFVAARLITGITDVIIMYVAVDIFCMNAGFWKLVSNIVVVILNYTFSKLFIFVKK